MMLMMGPIKRDVVLAKIELGSACNDTLRIAFRLTPNTVHPFPPVHTGGLERLKKLRRE